MTNSIYGNQHNFDPVSSHFENEAPNANENIILRTPAIRWLVSTFIRNPDYHHGLDNFPIATREMLEASGTIPAIWSGPFLEPDKAIRAAIISDGL